MEYVTLGKTGLKVSVCSFGGIPIQREPAETTMAIVDKLEEYGINYIDTARGYTVSEEYLGAALEGRRDKFYLATKSMSRDYESMKRDIGISMNNLRTDYIDVYQIHNCPVKDMEKVFSEDGAYRALAEAKAEGKIGHIGITMHHVEDMQEVLDKYIDKFETMMFPFNIVEDQGVKQLKAAKEAGYGIIAMKPLAGGNLDNVDLALRYILQSGVADIVIPGVGNVTELEQDYAACESNAPLNSEELAEIEKIRKELGNNFCRRCGYCMPCTANIVIPNAFLFNNYVKKYNMMDWAKSRYDNAMSVHASDCIQCGVCETRCPYHLPIMEMMKGVAETFGY